MENRVMQVRGIDATSISNFINFEPYHHRVKIQRVEPKRAILLVDDEQLLLKLLKDILESSGFRVFAVSSSLDAFNIFQKEADSIGLIITDLRMPLVNGWELIGLMRTIQNDIKAAIMTSYIEPSSKDDILEHRRVSEIFIKPFNPYDLIEKIELILSN